MGFGSIGNIVKRAGVAVSTGGLSEAARYLNKNNIGGFGGAGGGIGAGKVPQFGMKKTQDFMQNNPNIQIGGQGGRQALQKSFSGLKEQAVNRVNAAQQGNVNALQRRFSAMGASGSGAQIKAIQDAQDAAQNQIQEATQNIGAQEIQALQSQDLAQADLDFKNRVFSFDQASKMHELDLSERQQKIDSVIEQINARTAAEASKTPKQGLVSNLLGNIL